MTSLSQLLDQQSSPAAPSIARREGDSVRCLACAHTCLIGPESRGICKLRHVAGGELRVPWGYVAGLAVDPIEKKPFFHVKPGETALSFGMLGCNFHCDFCQNWQSSQTLRDENAGAMPREITPAQIVETALIEKAPIIVSTYNEPLITAEWSHRIFELAKEQGLLTGFVSNGNTTTQVLDWLRPVTDLYKVDLKCFDDAGYRQVGARLSNILRGIEEVHAKGMWLEVVTLVIPGFNDSPEELGNMASFLAGLSPEMPWHVTAYRPQYKKQSPGPTPQSTLQRAYEIGKEAGLHFVYLGNLPGYLPEAENTYCASCGALLVQRQGYAISREGWQDGSCTSCGKSLPGIC